MPRSMKLTVPLVLISAGTALAVSACSSDSDTTQAVGDFNKMLNAGAKKEAAKALQNAGVSSATAKAAAKKINFELDCPDSVKKGESFTCTVTGQPGGDSARVKLVVDSNDELTPTNNTQFQQQLNGVVRSASETLARQAAIG